MRRITTTIAIAFLAAASCAPASAATYISVAPTQRDRPDPRPVASAPMVDELVGYAVATIETFPNVDSGIGEALFSGRNGRGGPASVGEQERYLFNFRIPPGARLMRPRPRQDKTVGDMALVPEPSTWALMVLGFGLAGAALRRRAARAKLRSA